MSDELNREIKNIAEKIAEAEQLKDYEMSATELFEKDENINFMLGCYNEIWTVDIQDRKNERKVNLFIKFAYILESLRAAIPIRSMIENEIYFYTTVFPTLEKYRDSIGSSREHLIVPKYYNHSLETGSFPMEWLAIKNVKSENYRELARTVDLTHEHLILVFERYGYFSAHGYLLKNRKPKRFWKIVNPMQNIVKKNVESMRFCNNLTSVCGVISKFLKPGDDNNLIKHFKKYETSARQTLINHSDNGGKNGTIIHGNLWSNHVMFRHDIETGKPVHVRFVDWKCAKLGSPVCDLSFCIYSGAPKSILDNLDLYLCAYYNSLAATLRSFKCDPDIIYSYNEFTSDWKRYAKFGFLMALPVIFLKCSRFKNEVDDGKAADLSPGFRTRKYNEKKFESIVRDLLNHMVSIDGL